MQEIARNRKDCIDYKLVNNVLDSCKELGEFVRETAYHVIVECPRWNRERLQQFKDVDPKEYWPSDISKFLRRRNIDRLEKDGKPND